MSTLTQEQVKELFGYDAENGILIKKLRRGRTYNKPCGHNPRSDGYGSVNIDGKMYKTHRVIWLIHYGSWPDGEIDHLDRNKMNNRIDNLRSVCSSENQHNIGLFKNNSTGYPGVSWYKPLEKYRAQIMVNNEQKHLGYFDTAEEAFLAYQIAKIEYHPSSPTAQEYLQELTLAE